MNTEEFLEVLLKNDINYFSGVPDSVLKSFLNFIDSTSLNVIHRPAVNEGAAIAHAAGYYMSTNKPGLVYMQNSGLGNAINPLTSLADKDVYGIPMLLMIGWRGFSGESDELQHKKMGKVTLPILDCLDIPYEVASEEFIYDQIFKLKNILIEKQSPVAIVIKRNFFDEFSWNRQIEQSNLIMTREAAIATVCSFIEDSIIVSTTGKTSRELYEHKSNDPDNANNVFYMTGSMGHASAIGLEIALQKPDNKVYVFDGDGALLMHLGIMGTVGSASPDNFVHIVFDNASHDSTGGQPTVSSTVDFSVIAKACKYKETIVCYSNTQIESALNSHSEGPLMVVIKVKKGARKDLGRPKLSAQEIKTFFMRKL